YWMNSDDKDIRKCVVAARGKIDPIYFQGELIKALADPNHSVRAAAATALLNSGQDLTQRFSSEWRQILQAYELIGEYRFRDAQALGPAAISALRACLSGDADQVERDAAVVLESVAQWLAHGIYKFSEARYETNASGVQYADDDRAYMQ